MVKPTIELFCTKIRNENLRKNLKIVGGFFQRGTTLECAEGFSKKNRKRGK
ncbi:hypothetical protein CQA01_27110 [Cyclobacterium qasimii]|uniref:Uncharacterized protein n=1 Tax=Cyclobacterium qasimii TaxID=1350429 RepID=A0A512CDB6_9BACT|nr:hypothetical protein CQA01_27110 [Cyclobacterium qasimii]